VTKVFQYGEIFYRSDDGLRLFARDYNSATTIDTPVLCLPGLTRNSKDFETIAPWLAKKRRVIALDFRGRGRSDYAVDPLTYRPDIELADTIQLLQKMNIDCVAVIGTSRGGIVGLLMAALHGKMISGLLMNDIGPVLDTTGLLRIRSYLGVDPNYSNWDQAAEGLRRNSAGFDELTQEDWENFAKRIFRPVGSVPRLDYDTALARTFPSVDDITAGRVPSLWEPFATIGDMPISVLRGQNSDLLSATTVREMQVRNPSIDATVVPNRGHAPFLDEPESKASIARWLARVDAREKTPKSLPSL
jgi:pimeloyl-ACP methyl ester carboxylesterase